MLTAESELRVNVFQARAGGKTKLCENGNHNMRLVEPDILTINLSYRIDTVSFCSYSSRTKGRLVCILVKPVETYRCHIVCHFDNVQAEVFFS